tara:strand:- start:766 stop:954 length:189 start_codon:yes stop_codon:yes gene_type:complete
MLKSIKVSEKAYEDAKKLRALLEKYQIIEGVYEVKLSTAVSYAIKTTLESIRQKKSNSIMEK